MSIADSVHAVCRGVTDLRELRRRALEVVQGKVGFDAYAWLLTDPETGVGSSPVADVPCLDELPELIRLKYLSPVNRWTSLPAGRASALGAVAPGDRAGEHAWRAFLDRHGVRDVASTVFRDEHGCWAFLDLWRADGEFAAVELATLDRVLAPVTGLLRQCHSPLFEAPAAAEPGEPAVLLLSSMLEVRGQTAAADAHLRALLPTARDRQPVPATAYNVAAQLLANEAGADPHPPLTRVALDVGQWWTFRAARLGPEPGRPGADIAVSVERTSADDRLELYCRVHRLTERETQVVRCLADGEDTRAVSRRLHLSEFTVQDHLKSVFAKAGVRNRRSLLVRARG